MTQPSNILSFDKARQGAARARASSRRASAASLDRYAGLDYYEERYEDRTREEAERRASMREQAKRSRAKAKAERAFERQFGAADAAASAAEAGPRAAVYKGRMGTKHRQAARMQANQGKRANAANAANAAASGLAGRVLAWVKRPRAAVCASVLVCLIAATAFLYPTARTYYQALREEARLEAEYTALSERNQELEVSVAELQTDSGIEARARSQYGWVKDGEQAARVSGIDAGESSADISAKVLTDEVKAPETWYSPLLDPLFGVEG